VRAGAALAPHGVLDEAVAEPHQAEDQSHRHADEQDAEQAAHGPVLEVFQNELSGHGVVFFPLGTGGAGVCVGPSPTRCRTVPSGCSRTNLSGVTPLLISILTISITTAYSSRGRLISMCFGKGTLSNAFQSL